MLVNGVLVEIVMSDLSVSLDGEIIIMLTNSFGNSRGTIHCQ